MRISNSVRSPGDPARTPPCQKRGAVAAAAAWLLLALTTTAFAQEPPDPSFQRQQVFPSYAVFKTRLGEIAAVGDAAERTSQLNALWTQLRGAGQVPYAQDNQVAFLYRGAAASVNWAGDFNGWSPSSSSWRGAQLAGTDLWLLEKTLPADARLDYKIVAGGNWILDPANPLQMWSGLGGPNSELRMPQYVYPQETVRDPATPRGTLSPNVRIRSTRLNYDVNYRVYVPAGYAAEQLANLPTVYVTDGHEYAAEHLGSMVVTLDNLIAAGDLQPIVAVFVDPRDPNNQASNRRGTEYTQNASFLGFVADELRPAIDAAYRTLDSPAGRTILGTSLGGVNAAYFGAARPDVFGRVAVQSPASFSQFAPQTLNLYATQSLQERLKVFVTAGTIGDGTAGPTLANALQSSDYDYQFKQVNEGHSWGNWRGLIDDILIDLVGDAPVAAADFNEDGLVDGSDLAAWRESFGRESGAAHAHGDADGDRDVDGADMLLWQREAASGASSRRATAAAAEPASGATALILTAGSAAGRRRTPWAPRDRPRR